MHAFRFSWDPFLVSDYSKSFYAAKASEALMEEAGSGADKAPFGDTLVTTFGDRLRVTSKPLHRVSFDTALMAILEADDLPQEDDDEQRWRFNVRSTQHNWSQRQHLAG